MLCRTAAAQGTNGDDDHVASRRESGAATKLVKSTFLERMREYFMRLSD